ncbi:unnamed protein product [Psylliodes chrysocephalus]|uniref:CHK kinase-like domain-containing protein n=1 Tax=Psylliodes chrysocephalus TaxID=3402493 RepID=A0A9P0G2R1_9CUCU|nr:unnamed protein product [Psylliodes chrysocephala]
MEIDKIQVVLEVFLKDLNKTSCKTRKNFKNLSDLKKKVNGNKIDVEKFKSGVKKLISDFEEENFEEDYISNLIYEYLLIVFSNTTHSQRFRELHNILEHFYNRLVQKLLELEQTASIITNKKFNQVVRKLIPFVKLSMVSDQLTSVNIEQALQELYEIILYPNISREDCYEIIRNKIGTTNVDFVDFQVKPVNEKFGVMADYYRLKIDVKENGEQNTHHLFAKVLPSVMDQSRTMFTRTVFKKEQIFYSEFIPLLRKLGLDEVLDFLPNCYYSNDKFMIYDDVSVKGYSNLATHSTLSYEQLSSMFKQLSKLNSTGILFEEKLSKIMGKPVYLNEYYKDMVVEIFVPNETGFVDFFDCGLRASCHILNKIPEFCENTNLDNFKQQISATMKDFYEKVKPSKLSRNFLCHGDFWINNLLFTKHCTDCFLLDYQNLRYSSPAFDVQFVLYLHTDKKIRDNSGNKLLNEYYKNMKQNLHKYGIDINEIYSYETYQKSLVAFKPVAMIIALSCMQLDLLPKEAKHLFDDPVWVQRILTEDRTDIIDKYWDSMEVTKFKDIFEELYSSLNENCISKSLE